MFNQRKIKIKILFCNFIYFLFQISDVRERKKIKVQIFSFLLYHKDTIKFTIRMFIPIKVN